MEQSAAKNVIGAQVRQLREGAKLTQSDLVARCQVAGLDISRVALAMLESGKRTVTDYEAQFLALALRVPLTELFPAKPHAPERKQRNAAGPKPGSQQRRRGKKRAKKNLPTRKGSG